VALSKFRPIHGAKHVCVGVKEGLAFKLLQRLLGAAGGGVVYAGAVVADDSFFEWIAARLAKDAGIAWGARLPYGVETGARVGADNATVVFVINWNNAHSTSVALAAAAGGRDVLTNATVGADGVVTRLTSNSVGNFYLSTRSSRVVMPYTARVTLNGQTYAMETETSNGDCNSCHTPGGNGDTAGRIVAP
jgi:hypothetical protein